MDRQEVMDLTGFIKSVGDDVVASAADSGLKNVVIGYAHIACCIDQGLVRVTQIASKLGHTQQAVGKMLKMMERDGYAIRAVDQKDHRAKALKLTEAGHQLLHLFDAVAANWGYE